MSSPLFHARNLKSVYAARLKKSRHAAEEFGPGRKEFVFCPEGEAVYYKKSWHHIARLPGVKNIDRKRVHFALCPAHQMIKNGTFEGEVFVVGVPDTKKDQLIRTIKNVGDRAYQMDVLDRILDLRFKDKDLRVTTTENQLAKKIAKKIKSVFKKAKVETKFSGAEDSDVVRIKVIF